MIKFSEWTDDIVQQVWEKGNIVPENNPNVWRKDTCSAWIRREYYGNRTSKYGWEIDRIIPLSAKGSDDLSNLRPLQWENYSNRQAGPLTCIIVSSGDRNIRVG